MRATLRFVLYLLSFAFGGALMAYYLDPAIFADVVEYERGYPGEARMLAAGLCMLLTLTPLSILLRWLRVHRRSREISYSTERGRVAVNLVAVEEALTRALENEDCVKKAQVRVYEDRVKRQVVIESALTFWEVPNVTERTRQCQQLLRRRFAELMPEQSAVQVNLNLHRINPRKAEPQRKSEPRMVAVASEPAAPSPFAGTPLDQARAAATPVGNIYAEPPTPPATSRPALPAVPSEDELYVGPAYPVDKDDEEGSGGTNYIGRAIPAQGPAAGKKKRG